MNNITKADYIQVARQINRFLKTQDGEGLKPRVEAITRGTDGHLLLLNDDCYDLAQYKGPVQDIFYADTDVWVVEDNDFYLEPFDSHLTYKLAV